MIILRHAASGSNARFSALQFPRRVPSEFFCATHFQSSMHWSMRKGFLSLEASWGLLINPINVFTHVKCPLLCCFPVATFLLLEAAIISGLLITIRWLMRIFPQLIVVALLLLLLLSLRRKGILTLKRRSIWSNLRILCISWRMRAQRGSMRRRERGGSQGFWGLTVISSGVTRIDQVHSRRIVRLRRWWRAL